LVPDAAGNAPQEFSRILCFFTEKGGQVMVSVYNSKY